MARALLIPTRRTTLSSGAERAPFRRSFRVNCMWGTRMPRQNKGQVARGLQCPSLGRGPPEESPKDALFSSLRLVTRPGATAPPRWTLSPLRIEPSDDTRASWGSATVPQTGECTQHRHLCSFSAAGETNVPSSVASCCSRSAAGTWLRAGPSGAGLGEEPRSPGGQGRSATGPPLLETPVDTDLLSQLRPDQRPLRYLLLPEPPDLPHLPCRCPITRAWTCDPEG